MENITLPSALDTIQRNDYSSDAAYLEAAANLELKRSSPEFKKALQAVTAELTSREAQKEEKERAKLFDAELKKTRLTEFEEKEVDKRAQGEVADLVKSGRLSPENMQDEITKRFTNYQKEAIRRKATSTFANQAFRQAFGRVSVE